MGKKIDITGQKFGCIEVIRDTGKKYDNGQRLWECRCTLCGKTRISGTSNIKKIAEGKGCYCIRDDFLKNKKNIPITRYNKGTIDGTQAVTLTSKIRSDNTSGCKGVYWAPAERKWYATIIFKGKTHNLGRFTDKEEAIAARKEAEKLYFEPFLEAYNAGAFEERFIAAINNINK